MARWPTPELIVVGGSAGVIEALAAILPGIPPALPVPVALVVHLGAEDDGMLARSLAKRSALPVREPLDKESIAPGVVWLAPAGYHLLVATDRTFALSIDPPVQHARPSIDVLFESAAEAYGARCVGIVLTGANADGARGLAAIRQAGGRAMVQAPGTASAPYMPEAALLAADAEALTPPEIRDYFDALARSGGV